jgi:hypothetical protein
MAGAAVSLPFLECMLPSRQASAQTVPARYAILFAGQALGGDNYAKNQSRIAGQNVTEGGHFIADTSYGRGFALTTPLLPLRGMESDFTMVSNLAIPFNASSADAGAVPAGGAYRDFHGGGCSPLLSGTRSTSPEFVCNGITSDQVVAELNAGRSLPVSFRTTARRRLGSTLPCALAEASSTSCSTNAPNWWAAWAARTKSGSNDISTKYVISRTG